MKENNDLSDYLTDNQVEELTDLLNIKKESNRSLDNLDKDFAAEKISEQEFSLAKETILNNQESTDDKIIKIKI